MNLQIDFLKHRVANTQLVIDAKLSAPLMCQSSTFFNKEGPPHNTVLLVVPEVHGRYTALEIAARILRT
jgi:hypothetical protein